MDPDELLKELMDLVKSMRDWEESDEDPSEPGEYYGIATEFTQKVDDLNTWLAKGGFLPSAWEGDRAASVRLAAVADHRQHASMPGRDGWCTWEGERP